MSQLPNISFFKSVKRPDDVQQICLDKFYKDIINGTYKNQVEAIRNEQDPEKRKVLKESLPGVTPSGTFSHRSDSALIQHSVRICLDVDGKTNPGITDWPAFRTQCGMWQEVEFSSLSASGNGVFMIVVIAYPDKHRMHFKRLKEALYSGMQVLADSCPDVSRFRFMSYDPGATFRHNARPFTEYYKEHEIIHSIDKRTTEVEGLINQIISARVDITDSYKNWFEIGAALANIYGEIGRDKFHALSQFYSGYSSDKCDKQYDACLRNTGKYTAGTLYYYKKLYGI